MKQYIFLYSCDTEGYDKFFANINIFIFICMCIIIKYIAQYYCQILR